MNLNIGELKTLKLVIKIIWAIILFLAPYQSIAQSKNMDSKEIAVKSFSELELDGVFNVYLSQGNKEALSVKTNDRNALENIEFINRDDRLVVRDRRKNKKNRKTDIYITVKDLDVIEIKTVGNLKTQESLNLDDLDVQSSQVGNISMSLNCDDLDVHLSNVGNTTLEGTAKNLNLHNSCVGNVDALNLVAENLELHNSSVGNTSIRAKSSLDIESSSIGQVKYQFSGNEDAKNIENSGIGKVKRL